MGTVTRGPARWRLPTWWRGPGRWRGLPLVAILLAALVACGGGGVPDAPTGVTITPVAGGLRIDWTSGAIGVTSFRIYREVVGAADVSRLGLSPQALVPVATASSSVRSHYDFDVELTSSYRYAVSAVGNGGESDPTSPADPAPVTPLPGVNLNVAMSGSGTVTASGGGEEFSCSVDCTVAFALGTAVTLQAEGAGSEAFATWLGDCSGASACTLGLADERSVTAAFSSNVLRLVLDGDSPVSVSVSPAHGGQGSSECVLTATHACGYGYPAPVGVSVNVTLLEAGEGAQFGGFGPLCTSPQGPQGRYCVVNSPGGVSELSIKAVRTPVAAADSYQLLEDQQLTVDAEAGVLANDVDSPGDTLTAVLVAGTESGELTLHADGSFEYLPELDSNGTDGFDYRARDAYGNESEVTHVTLTVAAVNDAPSFVIVADPEPYTDGPHPLRTITDFASEISRGGGPDEAGQALNFIVERVGTDGPQFMNQPAISPAGELTYRHQPGTFGTATFSVRLQDNGGTANGGVNVSEPVEFSITAEPLTLTIAVAGSGTGTVTPSVGAHQYGYGTEVQVTASAAAGSRVNGWGGACSALPPSSGTCTVTMTEDLNVTVTFTALRRLSVSLTAAEGAVLVFGTVEAVGDGPDPGCDDLFSPLPRECAGVEVLDGQTVTLQRVTFGDFGGWGGACSGFGLQCQVVMDSAKTVTAQFGSSPP